MKQTISENQAQEISIDTWKRIDWQFFQALANQPEYENGRFYYDHGYMKIEINPLGANHGRYNAVVARVISLFATLNNISVVELTNTSYRKTGFQECQPDSSFYHWKYKNYYIREPKTIPPNKINPIQTLPPKILPYTALGILLCFKRLYCHIQLPTANPQLNQNRGCNPIEIAR